MKLYFILADISFKGGVERVTCNLANDLIGEHSITIISYFKSNEKINYFLDKRIEIKYITEERYDGKPGSIRRLLKFIKIFFKVNSYLKNEEVNYIISQSFPVAFLLFPLNFFNKKIIVCEHVHYDYYNKIIKWIRNILYKYYYKIVVLTSKDKEKFEKNLNNVEYIPNYISKISEKKSPLNNKVIISVGRLEEQKGYDILIDICSKLLPAYPEWKLKIFGEGNLKEKLEKQIKKNNISNQISLMGTTNEIEKEYLKSDIYVMSSRFEGFGMVLIEAMNMGLPLISFDCPNGPSDIIEDSVNGYLVKNFSKEKMFLKLEEMINNRNLLIKMQENSQKLILKFKKESILKRWKIILKEYHR